MKETFLKNSALKKAVLWLSSPYLLIVVGAVFIFLEARLGRNDFDIFLSASQDLLKGEDLYVKTYFDGYHYYYSLLFASILSIFSDLPLPVIKGFWILLNILFLVRIWKIIKEYLPFQQPNNHSVDFLSSLFGLLLFLISLRFIRANLHFGQVTILMLYQSLEGLHAVREKKWWGGIILGLGINIKWIPIVLLPYLLYRREVIAFCVAIVSILSMWYCPLLWLERDYFFQMNHSYWNLINPTQTKHVLDVEEGSFHGLTTWISTLFHEQAREHNALSWRRHIVDLPLSVVVVIVNIARLLIVGLSLIFLRAKIFRKVNAKKDAFFEWSWLLAVVPLIFPHQQHYAFLMMIPAMAFVLHAYLNDKLDRWSKILFFIVVVVFNLSLLLGVGVAVYNHYKIVTIAGLIMLFVLFRTRPKFQTE